MCRWQTPDFEYSLHPGNEIIGWQIRDEVKLIRIHGVLSCRELAAAALSGSVLKGQPNPNWKGMLVVDGRAVQLVETDAIYVNLFAQTRRRGEESAIVVRDDSFFTGLCRMYSAHCRLEADHYVSIYKTVEDLQEDLNLDLDWYTSQYS